MRLPRPFSDYIKHSIKEVLGIMDYKFYSAALHAIRDKSTRWVYSRKLGQYITFRYDEPSNSLEVKFYDIQPVGGGKEIRWKRETRFIPLPEFLKEVKG